MFTEDAFSSRDLSGVESSMLPSFLAGWLDLGLSNPSPALHVEPMHPSCINP